MPERGYALRASFHTEGKKQEPHRSQALVVPRGPKDCRLGQVPATCLSSSLDQQVGHGVVFSWWGQKYRKATFSSFCLHTPSSIPNQGTASVFLPPWGQSKSQGQFNSSGWRSIFLLWQWGWGRERECFRAAIWPTTGTKSSLEEKLRAKGCSFLQ